VPENLLALLKYCLLALLYLFFLRVLWAVWNEVRGPRPAKALAAPNPRRERTPKASARRDKREGPPSRLVVTEPLARQGTSYALGHELTVGRAAGCQIAIPDDTYVSQLHARVFQRDDVSFVEDLGSTNGTYLNGNRVTAPTPMQRGDNLQVGSTVLEVM
jgi:pSer/pThr/pTyr-binding forkhead associated (FHA) protein